MAGQYVGGVAVAVSLDVAQAIKQLELLDRKIKSTFKSGTFQTGGTTVAKDIKDVDGSLTEAVATTVVANKAFKTFGQTSKDVSHSLSGLGRGLAVGVNNPMMGLTSVTSSAGEAMTAFGGASAATAVSVGVVAAAVVAAAAAIGGFVAVTYKLGKAGYNSAKELEILHLSMRAITGSAGRAAQEVAALQAIAIESPFLTTSIINLDKFLISQGVASGRLRQGLTSAVLDLSAALGLTDDNLGSITYALAQVQARGYLSGDEMRQLANQFIPVMEALKTMPEYADLSRMEIRKMIEQAEISSTDFFQALITYTAQYEGIAADAALTTEGLINKLQDVTSIRMGQSFVDVDISPLQQINELLRVLAENLERVDWKPFAAALGDLVGIFTGMAEGIAGSQFLVDLFEKYLPDALFKTAQAVRYAQAVFAALGQVGSVVGKVLADTFTAVVGILAAFGISWRDIFIAIAAIAGVSLASVVGAFSVFLSGLGVIAGAVHAAIGMIAALFHIMRGDFARATAAWNSGIAGAQDVVTSFGNALTAIPKTMTATISAVNSLAEAFAAIGNIKMPKYVTVGGEGSFVDTMTNMSEGVDALADDPSAGSRAAKSVNEIAKVMDSIWDLTRQWRGMRSELETGLLGDSGFTATIEQILRMGQQLDEALITLGRTDVADWLYTQTKKLVALAEERNALTEQLQEGVRALDDLIRERDRFSDQIRRSAMRFAAALKVEEETVKDFTLMSERGFFYETETKKQKDYAESLRERGEALRKFFDDLKTLQEAGLSDAMMKELLTAGPEAAGAVASALAEGGQAMVDDVNVLYADIEKTADQLAEFGEEQFYDAGIVQAEALVTGLQDQIDAITEEAENIGEMMYEAVLPFAAKMQEAGSAGGAGLAKGISSSVPRVGTAMAGMDDELGRGINVLKSTIGDEDFADSFNLLSVQWIEDLNTNMGSMISNIELWVGRINDVLDRLHLPKMDLSLPSVSEIWRMVRDFFSTFWRAVWAQLKDAPTGLVTSLFGNIGDWISQFGRSTHQQLPTGPSIGGVGNLSAGALGGGTGGPYYGADVDYGYTPVVKVYIGDVELRNIVRTEVVYSDTKEMTRVVAGRRY